MLLFLTYGGYRLGPEILATARCRRVPTAVFLHNLSYCDPRYFNDADIVFAPSQYAVEEYRKRLGIEAVAVAPLILPREQAPALSSCFDRKYILFVNPEIGKGVCFFLALANVFGHLRPEVRFLAVEGRVGTKTLLTLGKKYLGDIRNIDFIKNTDSMDRVYDQAKLTLTPSLYQESFGRVAAESLASGVPVISSTSGALPEVVGAGGILIDIPPSFTVNKPVFPSDMELEPWVKGALRLWDDSVLYSETQRLGLEQACRWSFAETADLYELKLCELIQRHNL